MIVKTKQEDKFDRPADRVLLFHQRSKRMEGIMLNRQTALK